MTHLFRHGRESSCFPVSIILVKGRDCLCYKLSSRIDGLPVLSLVLLDKEKNFVLRAIDNTDIGLCVLDFAANKEREVRPRACHSFSTNITQNLEKLDGKIIDGGFTVSGIMARSSKVTNSAWRSCCMAPASTMLSSS